MTYEQVYNDQWWKLKKKFYVQCCDCGLVHEVKVRVSKRNGPQIQFNRDNRRTGQVRRWQKKTRT